MSEISGQNGQADPERFAGRGSAGGQPRGRRPARPRRGLRIALVSLASFVVLLGVAAVGGYAYVNQLAASIQRIPVKFAKLDGVTEPAGATTVLITSASEPGSSGLIMLLHLNAGGKRGGVVSIPPQILVQVPGHGLKRIDSTLGYGSPSLLVKTVEQLTHVQIDHYARINFTGVSNVLNVIGGVDLTLPKETVALASVTLAKKTVTKEHTFPAGVNHLNGITAVSYVRNPSFSPDSRVVLQQSLLRAILNKIANEHMLTNPLTAVRVVHATAAMLTVDSNFTNSEVESFATRLESVGGSAGTFETAPTHTVSGAVYLNSSLSNKLWAAIRHDSIAGFAAKYPATITLAARG
jgi:LCP family protein required for cell wall assembly